MIKDDVLPYPEKSNTGQPMRDKLFNWIVGRYQKNNHLWKKSDQRVWHGAIFLCLDYAWLLIWIAALWLIINGSMKRVGFEKTIFVVAIIFLIRINSLIKQLVQLNRKF